MEGLKPEILQEICSAKMPFGKYKDTVIADLPINYLEWFHREGMPKGKLGDAAFYYLRNQNQWFNGPAYPNPWESEF